MDRPPTVLYGPVRFTSQIGPYYTHHIHRVQTEAVGVTWPNTEQLLCWHAVHYLDLCTCDCCIVCACLLITFIRLFCNWVVDLMVSS